MSGYVFTEEVNVMYLAEMQWRNGRQYHQNGMSA